MARFQSIKPQGDATINDAKSRTPGLASQSNQGCVQNAARHGLIPYATQTKALRSIVAETRSFFMASQARGMEHAPREFRSAMRLAICTARWWVVQTARDGILAHIPVGGETAIH